MMKKKIQVSKPTMPVTISCLIFMEVPLAFLKNSPERRSSGLSI